MEMVWAVVPAVALAVLLLFTWRAVRAASSTAPHAMPVAEAVP
jgi:heme/copper-type cytochrome/quinol oxidase subunit 2